MDLIILIIILILPTIAQLYITITYSSLKKIGCEKKLSGQEVARNILDANGLEKIYVVSVPGNLSDHYDSSRKVVRLSNDIFNNDSVASVGVAAHECGHAIQDKEGYFFMKLRSLIFPIVKLGTTFSYVVILIGVFTQMLNIVYIGIALTALGLVFQLVTLPVEFDASKRALIELKRLNIVNDDEEAMAKRMLTAAALTYVAGVLTSILQILRLIMMFSDDRR